MKNPDIETSHGVLSPIGVALVRVRSTGSWFREGRGLSEDSGISSYNVQL